MNKWLGLLFVVALVTGTYYSLNNMVRFTTQVEQLLTDATFADGLNHWQQKGAGSVSFVDDGISIVNVEHGSHTVRQTFPIEESGYYQVTLDARVINVEPEFDRRAGAAVIIRYQKPGAATKTGAPLLILSSNDTTQQHQFVSYIPSDVETADLVLRLFRSTGQFRVTQLKLSKLIETSGYRVLKILVALAWLCVAVIVIRIAALHFSLSQFLALVALTVTALMAALVPEAALVRLTENISALVLNSSSGKVTFEPQSAGSSEIRAGRSSYSNLGHFIVFALLSFIASLNFRKIGLVFTAASIAVFAVVTEVLQLFVDRRTATLGDLAIDGLGAILGLFVGCLCILLVEKLFKSKDKRQFV